LTDEPEAPSTGWAPPGSTLPGSTPPFPGSPPPNFPVAPPRRKLRWWQWSLTGFVILLLIAVLAGFWIRLPYYTISPGGSLPVESRISVAGARTYKPHGSIRLLYVRERARVNVWRYVQAKLDPNIDLFKEKDFLQGTTPEFQQAVAENDMATAQINAEKVALE
jgi:PDZ domain-containing secreted protein